MNCLVLAAGYGSRLRSLSESKPLIPVNGVPLIEHVIARAAAGGATDFTIVTGHRAEAVEAFVATLPARLGVSVRTVRTEDWSRPNGFSVITGAKAIEGEYLLLMSDHLFDPAIAESLSRRGSGPGLTLAVDRDLANPLTDMEDATKVEVDAGDAIIRIGKQIDRFNAIDTGIFLASPALAQAILEAATAGKAGSLSDGVQRLADRRQAQAADIGTAWWFDVDDPPSHAIAEAHLAGSPSALRPQTA